MGEYAELALSSAMRRGLPIPRPFIGPLQRHKCSLCPKYIGGGFDGMIAHVKAKHGMKDAAARQHALALRASPITPNGA